MERTSSPVWFPLLHRSYQACTIPYRQPSDPTSEATPTELVWLRLFRNSNATFTKRAEQDPTIPDAGERAARFRARYEAMLSDLEQDPTTHGGPPDCILLCRLRELCLRELGFQDIFRAIKDSETQKALSLLPSVLTSADAIPDPSSRLEHLVRGLLCGNVFDLGAAALAAEYTPDGGGISFHRCASFLAPRPWVIDDLPLLQARWARAGGSWKKVVVFVDNAGADVVLGVLPLARELLRSGSQVVLAANDLPSINDVTYPELVELVAGLRASGALGLGEEEQGRLAVVNSGNDLPVIDLGQVSPELAFAAEDAELVLLVGMGRGIETNLHARFTCDALKVAVVKHPEVAEFLGGRLYDCVVKFTEGRPDPDAKHVS